MYILFSSFCFIFPLYVCLCFSAITIAYFWAWDNFEPIFVESGAEPKTASAALQYTSSEQALSQLIKRKSYISKKFKNPYEKNKIFFKTHLWKVSKWLHHKHLQVFSQIFFVLSAPSRNFLPSKCVSNFLMLQ